MENKIRQLFKDFKPQDTITKDSDWTKEIKRQLKELGEKHSYIVATSGFENEYEPEWLFDLIWYTETSEKKLLDELILAVESEWSPRLADIKYDFEKLLVSNAQYRLMICQAKAKDIEEYKKYFKEAIEAYKRLEKGSKFIIAIFETGNSEDVFGVEIIEK